MHLVGKAQTFKTYAVSRNVCAPQGQSNFYILAKVRDTYLVFKIQPLNQIFPVLVYCFFNVRSTIFFPSILGLPCNFFP